jgi:hypothetical protein
VPQFSGTILAPVQSRCDQSNLPMGAEVLSKNVQQGNGCLKLFFWIAKVVRIVDFRFSSQSSGTSKDCSARSAVSIREKWKVHSLGNVLNETLFRGQLLESHGSKVSIPVGRGSMLRSQFLVIFQFSSKKMGVCLKNQCHDYFFCVIRCILSTQIDSLQIISYLAMALDLPLLFREQPSEQKSFAIDC